MDDDSDEDMGFGLFEEAEAKEQVLSTTFNIPQQKTIPDDKSEHKVGYKG